MTYLTPFVLGAPWIATDYFQEVTEEVYDYDSTKHRYGYVPITTYEEIIPTATSLPEAIRTNSVVETDAYYNVATLVEKLYPSGAVGTPVPYSARYGYGYQDSAWTSIIWVVNLTYSAPTACSTQWTTTTAVTVTPPSDLTFDRLLPTTAASTSYSVYNAEGFQSSTYVYKYIWVEPTQVPTTSMYSLSDEYYPATLYNFEDKKCRYEGHDTAYYYNDYYYDDWYGLAISPLAILLISVLGWIGLWFLLGILEAWIRFRRLMTGWQTRRGLPVCWALTIMPLTLFCLCCFRRGYRARTAHDSAVLQSRWKKMSAWQKFVLFWKWGFRYKYPTILGPAPERVMPSKRPGKHPGSSMGPPLLYSTPPQTAAYPPYPPVSPVVSLNREAVPGVPGPQMSQAMPMQQHPMATAPAPAPQPVPEASGALQSEPRPSHEQQQTQMETRSETLPVTQPQQQNHSQDGEIGRSH